MVAQKGAGAGVRSERVPAAGAAEPMLRGRRAHILKKRK